MNEQSATHVLDIEEKLSGEDREANADAYCARLETAAQQVKRQLDQGVPPDQYRILSGLLSSYEAAQKVVRIVSGTAQKR
ncbi:EscE/YscE/SsaE family type III secretion system needle protein co-chaperone [Thalassospira sp. MA62]|nr:EscE/YscE/SsaE family type III secretion system needle protein co-chaperone [Thalassospira sp. MA62]